MKLFRRTDKNNAAEPDNPVKRTAVSCLSGTVVPMDRIPDPVFADGILGPCIGIRPPEDAEECTITAPADGVVTQCTGTGHAVGLACGGTEILIHAGIDTVQLAGKGFCLSVKEGESVQAGQPLLTMDAVSVRKAGYDPVVVIVVTEVSGTVVFTKQTGIRSGEVLLTVLPD